MTDTTARAKPRTNPSHGRTAVYRCSECGTIWRPQLFEGEWKPLQCAEHPDADMLKWTNAYQAAALYACQRAEQLGHTLHEIRGELIDMAVSGDEAVGTPRYNALTVAVPLLIAWGGQLPERRTEGTEKPRRGLFDG